MEALLPSEISRLVLGYLDEQSCTAAYQTFLETCPHLKECAEAALQGIRFSTRAAGKSLRDILNEYCLIYAIVQDRIQKLPESTASQLKIYGIGLSDQVKQLIDGKQTGQRFHVNITVPTQPKISKPRLVGSGGPHTPGSSHHMVTPTSSRMRRLSHPIQEQRLTLRSQDPKEDVTASVTVQRVETTQLENLPGSTASTPTNIGHPVRKFTHSGGRTHLGSSSECASHEQEEEENSSLLDPKTGELTSPLACQSLELSGSSRSVTREVIPGSNPENKSVVPNPPVPSTSSPRQSEELSDPTRTAVGNQGLSAIPGTQSESGCSRSSLDKFLINILSTHDASDNVTFHDKSVSNNSCSSVAVTRTEGSFVVPTGGVGCSLREEQSANQGATSAVGALSQDQERIGSCVLTSPNEKMAQKNPHEAYATTPRRSAAKRKTKPTPLKMMTPLKHKTGSDSSDSAEVVIDPKLFYGPLLDNRELHERIAENINQFIRPSGMEEGLESRDVNTTEEVSDAIASTSTEGKGASMKDLSTQEELERVIKTVVDKTESDPLFESLLCDILGPECDDDNIIESLAEEKSTHSGSSSGSNDARPEDGEKDPIALLEDQNEEAIKSILEAQPLMKDSPILKQGKTALKRKGKRVAPNSKTNVVKGMPSSAHFPITAELEIGRKSIGQEGEGVSAAASNENVQANGQDGIKLVMLPFQDVVMPPLAYPTIIYNGVPQCMVLSSQSKLKPIPIAPKETVNIIPGNPPFILRKISHEDVKYANINSSASSAMITDSQISFSRGVAETTVNAVVVQEGMSYSERVISAVHSIDLTDRVEVQHPVACPDPGVSVGVHISGTALGLENAANKIVDAEIRPGALEMGSISIRGSTPDVVCVRPTRAATEGRQKNNVEKEGDTPMMPAGKQRVSMSTPRRKSRGHIRALDFGSTPPKPSPSSGCESSSKVLTTSTPYDPPGKFRGIGSLRPPLAPNVARKELSKCLGAPRGNPLPDLSTTCIATRSPPPRLSGAWNKVGVDLIFGSDTSPAANTASPPSQGSHESTPDATKEHPDASKDGTKGSSRWELPKSKASWDAGLRAQLGDTLGTPSMTRVQMRAIVRAEKQKKKAEALATAEEAKKEKLKQSGAKRSSLAARDRAKNTSRCSDAKSVVKNKNQRKSVVEGATPSVQEKNNSIVEENPCVAKDARKSVGEEEEVSSLAKVKLNSSSEGGGAVDQLTVGEKRKRNSKGEVPLKKKVTTEARPVHEVDTPAVSGETTTSPEKNWVVQQSPGSWANKRSLHGVNSGKNLESEGCKFPSGICGARRCLDLHETPRKPDPSDVGERATQSSALTSKLSTAGDRTTLTVVDTPLFPPTPGVCSIGTPRGQDSSEAVETFPTYFKPREKDCSAGKEKQAEVTPSENVGIGAALHNSQIDSLSVDKPIGEREGNDAPKGAENSDKGACEKIAIMEDSVEETGVVESTVTNAKKKARPRKPPVRKTPAPKVKSPNRPKKGKSKVEEETDAAKKGTEDIEVLPTRVLRPRRKTSYLKELSEEAKGDDSSDWELKGSGKQKSISKKKKKPKSPEYVAEPCDFVPEEDITDQLVFKPLAPEVVKTQSLEAEVLARQIKLKLSPLALKAIGSEEEEEEGDSPMDVSSPEKIVKVVDQHIVRDSDPENCLSKETDSSASSHSSSSSESSSSDSSSEDEADHDDVTPAGGDVSSASEAVEKVNESIKNVDKEPVDKVAESGSGIDSSQLEKGGVKLQSSTSKGESIEKSDGENTSPAQCKKGGVKEVTGSLEVQPESEKSGQDQKLNTLEKKELNKGITFLTEQKKRRDNLEKILFGREYIDTEEGTGAVETEGTLLPLTDHSLSTELELKKQRTLEKLKGGKVGIRSSSLEKAGLNSPQNPPQSARESPAVMSTTVQSPVSPQKREGKLATQRSPRKSTPVKETTKMFSIFDGEEEDEDCQDDCPELRLSEGEDFEFATPEKIFISPRKFELLTSLEEKMAVLHGDITSPILKKTARMSCTSAASHSAENSPRKEILRQLCGEASPPGINSKVTEKECSSAQEQEAIPSTSKAAELRHKANERKYLCMTQAFPSPSRTSGVTIRKTNPESLRRSLRSNQLEAEKEDVLRSNESVQNNEELLLDDENILTHVENCEKAPENEEKNKPHKSSPKKPKEHGALQMSTVQNASAGVGKSQTDISKVGESSGALEPQAEVGSEKPSDKELTERESATGGPTSCFCPSDNDEVGSKQGKKQQKKRMEGAMEVEKSKEKLPRSRKKSGPVQDSNSKDGKSLLLDLDEDELTRDGFTNSESSERNSDQPPIVSTVVPSQKVQEASKNIVAGEQGEKQTIESEDPIDHRKELKKAGVLSHKNGSCDTPPTTSSGKNIAVNKRASSPSRTTKHQSHEDPSTLDVEQVREQLLEGARRQLNCTLKETSRKSSKNTSKSAQTRLPNSGKGDNQAAPKVLSAEANSSKSNVRKPPVKSAEKVSQVHSDCDKESVVLENTTERQEGCEKVRNVVVSPRGSLPSVNSEAPSTGVLSDTNEPVSTCSQVPAEEDANNASWTGSTDLSFSSNEVYITVVYDEDNPPISTSSVLTSQLGPPLSPSAPELEGLTVELDGEIVTITKSDYIELFSYTPKESAQRIGCGIRGKVISTIESTSKKSKIDDKQKVVARKKKDDDLEQKCCSKGGALSSDRKRKHTDGSEHGKGETLTKSSRSSRRKDKEVAKKKNSTSSLTDKEMASIQRVVDGCNDISNDENTVDDDSLMTYAAIGSVGSEENHHKEDEGSRKFLPLKKRRTTTEDTPVKSQADGGDVVNSNPGMFFPLNVMEIEDFLSKVHGDGS